MGEHSCSNLLLMMCLYFFLNCHKPPSKINNDVSIMYCLSTLECSVGGVPRNNNDRTGDVEIGDSSTCVRIFIHIYLSQSISTYFYNCAHATFCHGTALRTDVRKFLRKSGLSGGQEGTTKN